MKQRILRPMGYRDILDETFDLYKKHFLLFVGIAAVVYLPFKLLAYAFGKETGDTISSLIVAPVGYIAEAAATYAVAQAYLGNAPTILNSYRALRGRFFQFIGTMMIALTIIGAGFMLCIVPGVIFSCWYAFLASVFVIEGKSWSDARNRSKQLAADQWGRIIWLGFLSYMIAMIVIGLFSIPLELLATKHIFPLMLKNILYGIGDGIANVLVTPITIIPIVLLYYDVRVRKEGFDIELLAASIEGHKEKIPAGAQESEV